METCYRKQNRPARGIRVLRGLPRDAREGNRHPGRRRTSRRIISTGRSTSRRCARARPRSRTSPWRACSTKCGAPSRPRATSAAPSHLLAYSNHPDRHLLAAWIEAGVIGTVREVHNWTNRPFWPQGMQAYHESGPPVPDGLQLGAVAGARARSPVPSELHLRGLSRLVCVRNGLPWRHGPLQPVAALPDPRTRRPRVRRGPAEQRRLRRRAQRQRRRTRVAGRLPEVEHRPLAASRRPRDARRSTRSGTTAA